MIGFRLTFLILTVIYAIGAFLDAVFVGIALEKGEVVERHGAGHYIIKAITSIGLVIFFWVAANHCGG